MFRLLLTVLTLVACLPRTAEAKEDYRCKKPEGCVAYKWEDGVKITIVYRKGDLISTEAGWVVNPDDGWVKIRPGIGYAPSAWNIPQDVALMGQNYGMLVRKVSLPGFSLVAALPVGSSSSSLGLSGLDNGTIGRTMFLKSFTRTAPAVATKPRHWTSPKQRYEPGLFPTFTGIE